MVRQGGGKAQQIALADAHNVALLSLVIRFSVSSQRGWIMEIKYFSDTDTLLINFAKKDIVKTRDINENTLIEIEEQGNLISITIEHATQQMDIENFS
jgi:uncharacterized protein YuzE